MCLRWNKAFKKSVYAGSSKPDCIHMHNLRRIGQKLYHGPIGYREPTRKFDFRDLVLPGFVDHGFGAQTGEAHQLDPLTSNRAE